MAGKIIYVTPRETVVVQEGDPPPTFTPPEPLPQCSHRSRDPKSKWRKKELRRLKLPLGSQQMIQCPRQSTRTIYGEPFCENHRPAPRKGAPKAHRFQRDPYYDTTEWRILRFDVLIRDKHICQYCGDRAHQADHVIPRKAGGYDLPENLVAACSSCNRIAGNNRFPSFEEKKAWILSHRKNFLNDRRPTDLLDRIEKEIA